MGIKRRIRYSAVKNKTSTKGWRDRLQQVPCFILGNSPALVDEDIELLDPFFSIGINRAFYKVDSTLLFWQDIELWYTERKRLMKTNALKVCRDASDPQNRFFHYKLTGGEFKLPDHPGELYGSGATGPLAIQFAYALGCNPIIIIGMDCEKRGMNTDFYGRNRHHKPHTMENCRKGLKWVKSTFDSLDVDLVNCSAENKFMPYVPLKEIIAMLDKDKYAQNRAHWVSRLS